jgi:hypothetical protein
MEEKLNMPDEGILSVRSLIESDIGPLRRFTGVLDSMPQEKQTYNEGTPEARDSVKVSLNFKDLEVVESIEPYNFPIYTVNLTLSNRKKSKYGVFGVSLATILDQQYSDEQKDQSSPEYVKPQDRMDLADCVGKRLGLVMADGEDGRPVKHLLFDGRAKDEANPRGQDMPTACWEVYMVEGIGSSGGEGVNATEKAIDLLDGKTLSQFNQAALADDVIRADTELLQSIGMPVSAPNSFVNVLVTSKQIHKDKDGIYHKGPAPAAAAVKGKK